MKIAFKKYHALGNDFIIPDMTTARVSKNRIPELAGTICDRRSGVGADGILVLGKSKAADIKLDIFNADGSWAEKSGNGLRICAVHIASSSRKRSFLIETGTSVDKARLGSKVRGGHIVTTELGQPEFAAKRVPVRSRQKFIINSPVKIGTVELPMTCLAVGNPHAVILVEDFDFDWKTLGEEIEHAKPFPNDTNVEFVRVLSRKKVRVAEWERGAGATGSSGTGAGAVVATMVTLGLVDRVCEVQFDLGSLIVEWRTTDDVLELTGPVQFVMEGVFDFR